MSIRYRLTYIDMTTAQVILVRGSDRPEYRAYVPGIPVRIECEEIIHEAAAPLALAA